MTYRVAEVVSVCAFPEPDTPYWTAYWLALLTAFQLTVILPSPGVLVTLGVASV